MQVDKYAEHFLKLELMKANIDVFQNESGKANSLGFIAKTPTGIYHELHLQALVIDKEQSLKIPKTLLQSKDNQWVDVAMVTKSMDCSLYLVPSNTLKDSDKYSFLGKQNNETPYCEINVFLEAIPELSQFSLSRLVELY